MSDVTVVSAQPAAIEPTWPGNSLQALSQALLNKSLTVVVGSGGTMFSQPQRNGKRDLTVGGWCSLLKSGLDTLSGYVPEQLLNCYQKLLDGDAVDLLNIASKVESVLRSENMFTTWLGDTFGGLAPTDTRLYDVLLVLEAAGARIVTTNYDCLIEDHLGIASVSYGDPVKMQQWINRTLRGVLHIHGVYTDAASVVLGPMSYQRVIADAPLTNTLQALLTTNTLLFVGAGAGIKDPHMEALMPPQQQQNAPPRHYAIVQQSAVKSVRTSYIAAVPYPDGKHEVIITALCRIVNYKSIDPTYVDFVNYVDSRPISISGNNGVIVLYQAGLNAPGHFDVSLLTGDGKVVGNVTTIDPQNPVPQIVWNNLPKGTYNIHWAAQQRARHYVASVRITSG